MLFLEASALVIAIEKQNANAISSKSNKGKKDDIFGPKQIRKIMDKIKDGDTEDLDKMSSQMAKKARRKMKSIRNVTNNKFKNPMNMIRKRILKILNRSL